MRLLICSSLLALAAASFYDSPRLQIPDPPTSQERLDELYGTDFGFTGISTFAHLPHVRCLTTPDTAFDIAFLGIPFDTAVSFRPGARFGPKAIRSASARQTSFRGFNHRAGFNPYTSWATFYDCGDIPVTPFDNVLALEQMQEGYLELLLRDVKSVSTLSASSGAALDRHGSIRPKIISLGGDHSIALAALRALNLAYGRPVTVLHFDAHLDTWNPRKYPSNWIVTDQAQSDFNHGSMFWIAVREGLIANSSSVHAGLRTRLSGDDFGDYADDSNQGFLRIESDDIDSIGVAGVVNTIMGHIGTENPVYLSIDIDVIDPSIAPGTGTPEAGGWTTRELIQILRGIDRLNVVGADIVEVSPAYDDRAEGTALAGAQVAYEIATNIVKRGLIDRGEWKEPARPGNVGRSQTSSAGQEAVIEKDEL